MATLSSYRIRPANEGDLAQVHALIVELAIYERAPDEVTLTLEKFKSDFREGLFRVFVGGEGEPIHGMALYYPIYSTWKGLCFYLEDIVITESQRRKGLGRELFMAVLRDAFASGGQRLKWQALDWNEPAIRFYEKLGAEVEREWLNYRLTRGMMERVLSD